MIPLSESQPVAFISAKASVAALGRLWRGQRSKSALLYAFLVVLLLVGSLVPRPEDSQLAGAERSAFDMQMRLLRENWPLPISNDLVLIGVDEESEDVFTEPVALWHRHFARVLQALGEGRPIAVGVDVVPPERSYDDLVPGLDLALFRGIRDARQQTVLVFAITVDREGRVVRMHPTFARVIGESGLGLDQQLEDPDRISRRFSERELGKDAPVPTLVGQILRGLGRPVGEGYIDYSVGSQVSYVPMQDVVAWLDGGEKERLRRTFEGRIVLIGYVSKRSDRWELPVQLIDVDHAEGRRKYSQPGVVTHLQVLRSHLARGLLTPVSEASRWTLCLLTAALVFFRYRFALALAGAAALTAGALAVSLYAIRGHQLLFPLASVAITLWVGFGVRFLVDAIDSIIERGRLKRSFAGQVSPAVMSEMLDGSLSPGVSGQLADVCVLFSDIRDFTTLSERMPPVVVMTVLQRYFDRMVQAVHRYDGTVDKFIGDGMMVLFGAPRKSADPCGDAVQCALAMMTGLDDLNAEFAREGLPTLTIGIGINFGKVTVGNIGSSERHNYSAIGDAVNVAARLEGLTKAIGRKILITEAVVSQIGERFEFDSLGSHSVKGHSPVNIWGIRTAKPTTTAA
jgi:class 3 adenylate cyclase/CHASE2 domain-containing sensor protein